MYMRLAVEKPLADTATTGGDSRAKLPVMRCGQCAFRDRKTGANNEMPPFAFLSARESASRRRADSAVDRSAAALLVVLVLLLGALFIAVLWCPKVATCTKQLLGMDAKRDVLTFLGLSMGGMLVALQAVMSYRRAKAMEDTSSAHARANENASFQSAIRNLGDHSTSVRVAGAYELIHLARHALELRESVQDILYAHIRRTTGEDEYQKIFAEMPSEEIQSMLTLLLLKGKDVFDRSRADLQRSRLNGVNLRGAWLVDAVLSEAQLNLADLQEADLRSVNLMNTQLRKANLSGADLRSGGLEGADLRGACLSAARLCGARMGCARLQNCDFRDSEMQYANLSGAQVDGANFEGADLEGVQISDEQRQSAIGLDSLNKDRLHS